MVIRLVISIQQKLEKKPWKGVYQSIRFILQKPRHSEPKYWKLFVFAPDLPGPHYTGLCAMNTVEGK